MIFPSTYLGPLSWYARIISTEKIVIDVHEHYIKQTTRNRCTILGPNGQQDLVIPVKARNHTPMKEVMIDHSEPWQRKHWGAIRSAYGQSPFFNFYADHFYSFYSEKRIDSLVEYNSQLLELTLKLLKSHSEICFTNEFVSYSENDLRLEGVRIQTPDPVLKYTQVFSDRFPFIPDLSIMDLLCCCGPDSKSYLQTAFNNFK